VYVIFFFILKKRARSATSSILVLLVLTTSKSTSSSGGDKTDLSTGRFISGHGRGFTNMLVVTTTMGMLNRVHSNTSNLGPSLSLAVVFVISVTGLQDGLISSGTGSDQTNHGSGVTTQGLSGTGGESDSGLVVVLGVTNDDGGSTGGSGKGTLITGVLLDVANGGTFGDVGDGHNVTGGEGGLLTAVNELAGVHTLSGDEVLALESVSVRVSEDNSGEGSTTSGVVDDLFNDTLDVTSLFSIIESSEGSGSDSQVGVGLIDTLLSTLSLSSDDSSHYVLFMT